MSEAMYPGYDSTDESETFDFPYHGGGRKGIRHKIPFEGGEVVVHLGVSEIWEAPSVNLDVAWRGPGGNFRINPGRRDMAETIVEGHGGH